MTIRNHKGQLILPQYVLAFFLVIAAMVAISLYVQRALQARVRDARLYMVDMAAEGCKQADAKGELHCQEAAGMKKGVLWYEYEPYYGKVDSKVSREHGESKALVASGIGTSGIFIKKTAEETRVDTASMQLPPCVDDGTCKGAR